MPLVTSLLARRGFCVGAFLFSWFAASTLSVRADDDGATIIAVTDLHESVTLAAKSEPRSPDLENLLRQVTDHQQQPPPSGRQNLLNLLSNQAWANMQRGFVPLAEQSFRAVLNEDANHIDARAGLGAALLLSDNASEAIEHLETAVDRSPNDARANFWLGRAYLNEQYTWDAVDAFEAVEAIDSNWPDLYTFLGSAYLQGEKNLTAYRLFGFAEPSTNDMRYTLRLQEGTALAALGLRGSAYGNFYSVLDEAGEGTQAGQTAADLIGQLDDAVWENRWFGYFRYSQRHDSNPAVLPDVNVFGVAGLVPEPNFASLIDMRLSYQIVGDADWDLVAGSNYYQTLNYELHDDVDVLDVLGDVTFNRRWIGWNCNLYQFSIAGSYNYLAFGYTALLNRGTATAALTVVDSDETSTSVYGRFTAFDFLHQNSANNTARDLDADNYALGITRSREFPRHDLTVQLGYQFDRQTADGADFDYTGHRLLVGATWEPECSPWTFGVNHFIHFRSYENIDSLFGRFRDDEEFLVTATASYELRENLNLFVEYNLDRNDSTLPINDYQRDIWGIGMLCDF